MSTTELVILAFAAFGAGAIRGFSGFGDALFFLPIGGTILSPMNTIMVFMIVALVGPMFLVPQAMKTADRSLMVPLGVATALATPFGFAILSVLSPDIFRVILAVIAITLVFLMAFGIHPNFTITPKSSALLGAAAGFVGGFTGVPGSILIFVLLNSNIRASQTRALSLLTLIVFDFMMLLVGTLSGNFTLNVLYMAAVLTPFYFIGSWLGRLIFNPEHEKAFRTFALCLIFFSGLIGLGLFQ